METPAVISHRCGCIRVRQPKCAGTSVLDRFLARGGGRRSCRPQWGRATLPQRIQRVARAMDLYTGHLTYSFVRNACRRFLSRYRHAGRYPEMRAAYTPNHPASNGTLREFAELCAELLADTGNFRRAPATAFFRDNG